MRARQINGVHSMRDRRNARNKGGWEIAQGLTYSQAYDNGSLSLLRNWFQINTGPIIPLTKTASGNVVITNQADADELAGTLITGTLLIDADGVDAENKLQVQNFAVNWDGTNYTTLATAGLIVIGAGRDDIHISDFRVDGGNHLLTTGLHGSSYSQRLLVERGEILRCGNDSFRTHKNSIYRHMYVHSHRLWVTAVDGAYDGNLSQDLYPHSDGVQTIRSGNLVDECWIENNSGESATSGVILGVDTNEILDGFTLRRSFIDGGGYIFHIHNLNKSLANPGEYGYPRNLVFEDNLIGRNARSGVWSHHDVPSDFITKTNNRWADTRALVPDIGRIVHPNTLTYQGDEIQFQGKSIVFGL